MSWPTWSAATAPIPAAVAAPVQSTLLPAGINSAPAVMPPTLQYSQEQWAQAQQQNWQQWAQWQQQYQQWHQQYGAEYQKSMSAMQGALATAQPPLPSMPNTGIPPPLPTENKPPLPPEDPPANQPSVLVPSYSTMPPKSGQGGYSTAPPLLAQSMPPNLMTQSTAPPSLMTQQINPLLPVSVQPDQYGNQRQNWSGYQNKRPLNQGDEYDRNKRPVMDRGNQWGNQKQTQWQSQLPPQQLPTYNQPPPQSQQVTAPKGNIEELSEAEKKFDKEFAAWEAQFNKWKDQNANHPDKTQYREYEKKWESWRNSLLERREQMRRKRLALTGVTVPVNKPTNFSQPPPAQVPQLVPQHMKRDQAHLLHQAPDIQTAKPVAPAKDLKLDNLYNNPPPHQNNEPLSFKPPSDYPAEDLDNNAGDGFLKSSGSSGGIIPGLDLVKEDDIPENRDVIDLETDDKNQEKQDLPPVPKGPDFDAISKGIKSILGDQKLLSMLSIVSQNPPVEPSASRVTDTLSNMKSGYTLDEHQFNAPPPPAHQYSEAPPQIHFPSHNDQSNHSYEDRSIQGDYYQQRESVHNFDDQTRSSFTMGPADQDMGCSTNTFGRNAGRGPSRFTHNEPENERLSKRPNVGPGGFRQNDHNFDLNLDNQFKFGPKRSDFGHDNFNRNETVNRGSANNNQGNKFNINRSDSFTGFNRDNVIQENEFNKEDSFRGNNFGNKLIRGKYGNLDHFETPRANFPGNNRSNNINQRDGLNESYNRNINYNQQDEYDDYENYNEDDDYDKYHNMFNEDDEHPEFSTKQNNQIQEQKLTLRVEEKPVQIPEPPPVEDPIFEPTTVIDYEHKSLKPVEPDVAIEPIHMFDYRHKPLNRIPVPQRPKWLSECVKFIREFDPLASRTSLSFERPPVDRYGHARRDDWQMDVPEDRYAPRGRGYDERDRYFNEFENNSRSERRSFNRENLHIDRRDERDYAEVEDRNRHKLNDGGRPGAKRNFDEFSRGENKDNRNARIDFDELSEDDMDWEAGEQKKLRRERKSASKSPILSNPPNPASSFNAITMIEDIIDAPGRFNRPPRIVIILRGPPGSGKTFLAKLIKDKEVENGGSAPRILSLDDYFMVEHEKEVMEDGKPVKVKEMVYEYEAEMEEAYRTSFIKSFKKTITDGYFPFVIVDNVNDKVKYFGEMWSFAKQNGFQVYICQMDLDSAQCVKRNTHNRSETEIEECIAGWEPTPSHHPTIDASGLLQASAISEVEMEEVEQHPEKTVKEDAPEDEVGSKWDTFDCSINNLAKLDGVSKPLRPSRTMEEYLQLEDEWQPQTPAKSGQKRVRWADLEEQRQQKKMRDIGFVVGQTNWDRMMDPTGGSSALIQTKYFDRVKH